MLNVQILSVFGFFVSISILRPQIKKNNSSNLKPSAGKLIRDRILKILDLMDHGFEKGGN